MKLDLFDANLYLGLPTKAIHGAVSTATELQAYLKGQGIARALVWNVAQHEVSPVIGNTMLSDAIAGHQNLFGCWTILPPQTNEVIKRGEDFFAQMKQHRITALRAFPDSQRYLLNRQVFGTWMDEVVERRIPLLLSLEKGNSWAGVYHFLDQYPQITCILCDIGIWGVDRYTWPLLENYPHVHLETSLVALEDGGMEATVAQYGAERLLFGSAFPERYAESSILQLLHADITDEDKRKIAAGNMQRLLDNVQL
jgi:uncharacterized protein